MRPVIKRKKGQPAEYGLFLRLDELQEVVATIGRAKADVWKYPGLPIRPDHPFNSTARKAFELLKEAKAHALRK